MANGFRTALRATGSPDNAIVTQRGSTAELTSGFSRDNANTILVDSRVARDAQGRPLASPEIVLVASLPRRSDRAEVNVTVRGVSQMALAVRHGVRIEQGRSFTPGLYELVVGKSGRGALRGRADRVHIKLQRRELDRRRRVHVAGQRIRERNLGRRRGDGPRVQPHGRISVADVAAEGPFHRCRVRRGSAAQPATCRCS